MRLFLISLLFVFMVYCVPVTAVDDNIKCYGYEHMSRAGDKPVETGGGEKDCLSGPCKMAVQILNGYKTFQLDCGPYNPSADAKEKPCAMNDDNYYECLCSTSLCFTKEMRKQAMYEYEKSKKITTPIVVKAGPWDKETDQGSTVFSSSFVIFTAVLVFSTL